LHLLHQYRSLKCKPTTTGRSVTAVWTIERSDATADQTEMTASHTTQNFVVKSSPNVSSFIHK